MTKNNDDKGYILEYVTIGNSVKVTVLDPQTLKEVSIIGNSKTSRRQLAAVAIRKLRYVLDKEKK